MGKLIERESVQVPAAAPKPGRTNIWAAALLALTAIVNFIGIFIILPSRTRYASSVQGAATGRLIITVKEAMSNLPLENATVCVIETNSYYKTGKDGKTKEISVPILKNDNFEGSYPRPWGEVTLLAYRDGYIDYILFYVMVYEGLCRNGPNLFLYPIFDPEGDSVHSIIEGPENAWVEALVKKYRK